MYSHKPIIISLLFINRHIENFGKNCVILYISNILLVGLMTFFFLVDEDIALLKETKGVSNSDLGVGGLSSFEVQ